MTAPDGDHVRPVVIAHLSDLHLGAHLTDVADALVEDVRAAVPTVTVVTGDLTMRARASEFSAATDLLHRLPAPRLVVLGNHDVPLQPVRRLGDPYRRYLDHVRLDLDPVLDVDGIRVLGLQSMPRWRWKNGRISRRQAEEVARILRASPLGAAPAEAVRVLALHHPASASGSAALLGRRRLLVALAEARVELVLAGHTHVPSVTWMEVGTAGRPWRVLEEVAGTATSSRLRGTARSWSLLRVDEATISVEERCESGAGWITAGIRRFPRPPGAERMSQVTRPG
jgi:3',5'-cyclic AMP phosphodiesterase CpdA